MADKVVLLTGAGFTHNYGGPLGSEMWSWIFNNRKVQASPKVREELLKNPSFEAVYNDIMEGSFNDNEKMAIREATREAYNDLDSVLSSYSADSNDMLQDFISLFGSQGQAGYIFTLNQDLFVERKYYRFERSGRKPLIPGVEQNMNWFNPNYKDHKIKIGKDINSEEVKTKCRNPETFYYIKLHGSQNWFADDETGRMIIGRAKKQKIIAEPLLRAYFDVFNEVLNIGNVQLVILGYGFGDEHINESIYNAIRKSSLRIHIVTPVAHDMFCEILSIKTKDMIRREPVSPIIWNAVAGYYQCTLKQMFPADRSESIYYKNFKKNLFNLSK